MLFKVPDSGAVSRLRALWKEAFGDTDAFLDTFFETAYAPERCCVAEDGGETVGMVYWFDCLCCDRRVAYIYGLATAQTRRGQGIARALMARVHALLEERGYAAVVLVPAQGLFGLYERLGYRTFGGIETVCCQAGEKTGLHSIDGARYAQLRRVLLPDGGVEQPGVSIAFLEKQAQLYAGEGFLLAARLEGDTLIGLELLGDASAAPGITAALGAKNGRFRIPGAQPFAMYCPLRRDMPAPSYFGLAFD